MNAASSPTPPTPLPTPAERQAQSERAALRDAATWWQLRIRGSWAATHLQTRGIAVQAATAGAGYAPPGWTDTVDYLRLLGYRDDTLLAAGLAMTSRTGGLIDRFRDRLMLPVHDHRGQLAGFLGRAADPVSASTPKWINSPASHLYDKSSLLYGLSVAAPTLRRGALPLIVEGPTDRYAIAAASRGIAVEGLAPCGTALTSQHVTAIRSVIGPDRPIGVCLDADQAGQQATLRAWNTLNRASTPWQAPNLLHVQLPAGTDPAELIQQRRSDELHHAIVRAQALPITIANLKFANIDLDHVGAQAALLHHLTQTDLPYVNRSVLPRYITHVARHLDRLDPLSVNAAMIEAISPGSNHHHTQAVIDTAQSYPARPAEGSPTPTLDQPKSSTNRDRQAPRDRNGH